MDNNFAGKDFLSELNAETVATRKCLERIPPELSDWKPHEKSMNMGYLTLLVAEMPKWITYAIGKGEIDLATFEHIQPETTEELVSHYDENIAEVRNALKNVSEEILSKTFFLKLNGQILYNSPIKEMIGSTINHWVHHRGQLTVYMRMNDIPVPSIYGPSADDNNF